MKLIKILLTLLLSINLSWTPCHASECVKKLETTTSSILENRYVQITAFTLSAFLFYKYYILPTIPKILLHACKEDHTSIIKFLLSMMNKDSNRTTKSLLFSGDNGFSIGKHIKYHLTEKYTYLYEAYRNNHLDVVKILLQSPVYRKHKLFITYLLQDQEMLKKMIFDDPSIINKKLNISDNTLPLYKELEKTFYSFPWHDTLLHTACRQKDTPLIEFLIEHKADLSKKNFCGNTPLHIAVKNDDLTLVEYLILNSADINIQNYNGDTPLHTACKNNLIDMAQYLIKHGACLDTVNENNNTPLYIACDKGFADIIHCLLEKGANPNIIGQQKCTPLTLAEHHQHTSIVNDLISHGATNHTGKASILLACERGLLDVIVRLIENGADINAQDAKGDTPLHYACEQNYPEIVEYLIAYGANLNITNHDGRTVLHTACISGHPSIVQLLTEYDSKWFKTAILNPALIKSLNQDILNEIKKRYIQLSYYNDAKLNIQDKNGNTPLRLALNENYADITEYLTKLGAGLDIKNKGDAHINFISYKAKSTANKTCVILGCDKENLNRIISFIEEVGNINVQDEYGDTLLHYAYRNNYPKIAQYLISQGANLNKQNRCGSTPLHIAWMKNCEKIVHLLVEHNAHLNIENNDHKTPYSLLTSDEHHELRMGFPMSCHNDPTIQKILPLYMHDDNSSLIVLPLDIINKINYHYISLPTQDITPARQVWKPLCRKLCKDHIAKKEKLTEWNFQSINEDYLLAYTACLPQKDKELLSQQFMCLNDTI